MAFRCIREKITPNGSTERLVTEFAQAEVVFGRGGESHVLLASSRVGTAHAKFVWESGALFVRDLGSATGTRVNGKRVSRCQLNDGDVLELGDTEVKVRIESGVAELTYLERDSQEAHNGERTARQVAALMVESHLPRMSILSLVAVVLVFAAYFAYPMGSENKHSWSPGVISHSHQLIEGDCRKCHAVPFQQVQDKECGSCHMMSEHAEGMASFLKSNPHKDMRCAQCHMEHNGPHGTIISDERQCVSCHAGMSQLEKSPTIENVSSFDTHPQFKVPVWDEGGAVTRVSLDDTKRAVDSSQIKLNHKVHLEEGLRGKDGPVTLGCNDCHKLSSDSRTIEPIKFEKHCQDCHSLGFDERLPNAQVPHGDSEAVYPALFAAYTKVILLKDNEAWPNPARDMERLMPGQDVPAPMELAGDSVDDVVKSARDAERELFTKTACFLCHSYQEKPAIQQTTVNTHYEVINPHIPSVWFSKARFSHGSHEEFTCESCHPKTRESSKTADLLLPGTKLCQECHSSVRKEGFVSSPCLECHSYHDALGFPAEKKQDIAAYLKELTR